MPVSPWPGKCFAVASIPWSCSPRTSAATSRPTVGRVLAERAGVDDRVGGIVVDVGHRREGEMDADRAALERRDPADVVGGAVAPGGAHAHIGWEERAAVESDAGPALEVRGDEQRQLRALLQAVELGRDVERRADRHDDPADVQRVHPAPAPGRSRRRRRRRRCPESRASPAGRSCRAPRASTSSVSTSGSPPTASAVGTGAGTGGGAGGRPQAHSRTTTRARSLACIDLSSLLGAAVDAALGRRATGAGPAAQARRPVRPGIDVLLTDSLRAGARAGGSGW